VSTYCYVDTILHGATLAIKMGLPDAYSAAEQSDVIVNPLPTSSRDYLDEVP